MNKIFLLVIVFCFSFASCNTGIEGKQVNPKEVAKMDTDTVEKTANKKYFDLGKKMLSECFNFTDDLNFKNKVKELFLIDLDLNARQDVVLGIHDDSELALNGYNYIIPSFYNFQYGESEKEVSIKIYKQIGLDKEVCAYNNMIFYNDIQSTSFIKKKHPEFLINLVKIYGYSGNKDWLQFSFSKSELYKPEVLEAFLFDIKCRGEWRGESGDCNTIVTLRKDMLAKMIEYGAELSQLHLVANMVSNGNQEMYSENTDELYNYLIAHCYAAGQSGIIEYVYDTNPKMKDVFRKNNYYNIEGLEEYTNELYTPTDQRYGIGSLDPDPYLGYGVINDPDGYTNLRDGQGTNTPVVKKIVKGEKFAIKSKKDEWWLVVIADGTQGWIHKSRITITEDLDN